MHARQFLRVRESVTVGREQVMNMDRLSSDHRQARRGVLGDWHALQAHGKRAMVRAECQAVSVLYPSQRVISTAQLTSAFDDGLQHRLNVGRRGGDHVQDVRAAGLIGESLSEIARLGLYFVEQPHVLDRDDGLVREGLQQLNLLFGKRLNLLSVDQDRANQRIVLEHGNSNDRARATVSGSGAPYGFSGVVGGEAYPFRLPHPVKMTAGSGFKWPLSPKEFRKFLRHVGFCRYAKPTSICKHQVAELSLADPNGVLQYGLKNWRQFPRGRADDPEHLG